MAASTSPTPTPSPSPGATVVEVQPDAVAALGAAMSHVASDLRWHAAEATGRGWALGRGHSTAALAEVLGDFEHQRLVLGRALDALAGAVTRAGGLYVEVEDEVVAMFAEGGAR